MSNIIKEVYTKENLLKLEEHLNLQRRETHLLLLKKVIKPRTSWLDIGCGTGTHLSWFKHKKSRIGIDPSEEAIAIAKARHSDHFFEACRLEDYAAQTSRRFDVISLFGQPYFFAEDINVFCESIRKLLKPNGQLIIEVYDHHRRLPLTTPLGNHQYIYHDDILGDLPGVFPKVEWFKTFFDNDFKKGEVSTPPPYRLFHCTKFSPISKNNPNSPEKISAVNKRKNTIRKQKTPEEMMTIAERNRETERRLRERVREKSLRKWAPPKGPKPT